MSCRLSSDLAFRFAKTQLPAGEAAAFERHARACAACAGRVNEALTTVTLLRAAERVPHREGVDWDRLQRASMAALLEGHRHGGSWADRIQLKLWIPLAAAVAAGLAIVVWKVSQPGDVKRRDAADVAVVTPATTREEMAVGTPATKDGDTRAGGASAPAWRVVAAAGVSIDGVEMRAGAQIGPAGRRISTKRRGSLQMAMGAHSRLTMAGATTITTVRASPERTEVALEVGRVSAEIDAKGRDGRFVIKAGAWTVEVRATVFSVDRDAGRVRVETVEGTVAVMGPGLDQPALVGAGELFDTASLSRRGQDGRRRGDESARPGREVSAGRDVARPREPQRADTAVRRAPSPGARPVVTRPSAHEVREDLERTRQAGEEYLRELEER